MKHLLAAAALAAAGFVAPVAAQDSRRVAVADLDLGRPQDVAKLDHRIAAAARRVCTQPGASLYGSYVAARTCRIATRRAATLQRNAAVQASRGVALARR